ncbi:MAG: hypothetical protein RLZZ39_654, partial [Actinomycetota bacterium]
MQARTTLLDVDLDLNDVARGDGALFVRDGVGFAGRGVAAHVDESEALAVLRAIEHDDRSSGEAGPLAFGALPFLASDSCRLTIPEIVVRKTATGNVWVTFVGDPSSDGDRLASLAPPVRPTPHSSRFVVSPRTPVSRHRSAVESARDAVRRGDLVKAVIARELTVESDDPIDVHSVLLRLRASFGSSYRYSCEGLIGASPELLVSVEGDVVRSHPLAGTTPRTGDPVTDAELARALVASVKDQVEHRVVIDVVHDMLLPDCSYLDWEPEPSIVPVANVQHLGTLVEGRLSDPRPDALSLARRLCPTPA